MTDQPFLLLMGAFITSSGFASLVAIGAAWLAWRAAQGQIEASRSLADDNALRARELADRNDTRQRWWEAVQWFHQHRKAIGESAFLDGIESLTGPSQVKTEAQRAILRAVTQAPKPE